MSVALDSAADSKKKLNKAKVGEKKDDKSTAKKKDPLAKLVCPVSGKAIDKSKTVAYKKAKVYFCCENCPKAFAKDTKKFATKANHQLAVSGQFQQTKCPIKKGKNLNKKQSTRVAGVDVAFCCGGCKAKVAGTKGGEQVALVFNEASFGKAYIKKAGSKGGSRGLKRRRNKDD